MVDGPLKMPDIDDGHTTDSGECIFEEIAHADALTKNLVVDSGITLPHAHLSDTDKPKEGHEKSLGSGESKTILHNDIETPGDTIANDGETAHILTFHDINREAHADGAKAKVDDTAKTLDSSTGPHVELGEYETHPCHHLHGSRNGVTTLTTITTTVMSSTTTKCCKASPHKKNK